MKIIFIILIIGFTATILNSCDTPCQATLQNDSDEKLTFLISSPGLYRHGIVGADIIVVKEDESTGIFQYQLESKKGTVLAESLNGMNENSFGFDTLTLILRKDTTIIYGKKNIFEKFSTKSGSKCCCYEYVAF
jgi:hypothetical protein